MSLMHGGLRARAHAHGRRGRLPSPVAFHRMARGSADSGHLHGDGWSPGLELIQTARLESARAIGRSVHKVADENVVDDSELDVAVQVLGGNHL